MNIVKRFSPALYLVVLIGFFLPFIEISCSATSLGTFPNYSFSGYSIMTGSAGESLYQTAKNAKSGVNIILLVVFIMTIIGLILTFFRNPKMVIGAAVAAVIGLVFLLIFQFNLDTQVKKANQYMAIIQIHYMAIIQIHYKTGFWLSLVFLLMAPIVEILFFFTQRGKKVMPAQSSVTEVRSEGPPVS